MTPSPWALERAEACDPLDDHEGSDVTRHRIALMLDAASAAADERARVLRECAGIVRRYYPLPPELP